MADVTWIVPEADRQLTPNRYHAGYMPRLVKPVEFAVYHFTAGSFAGALRELTSSLTQKSAHFLISKTGRTMQLAPLTDRTFHAGGRTSTWRGKSAVNNRSIGVEIENWGRLETRGAQLVVWTGKAYQGTPFTAADGSVWDSYTEPQVLAVVALTMRLATLLPVLAGSESDRLVGHQDVDPSRKVDPGPAFPWAIVRAAARGQGNGTTA